MKGFWTTRRIVLTLLFVVCLFFVLFVGRSFNKETFERDWILTPDWFNYFRKWLDISWWTKLVYKIDYSKYEEIYSAWDLAEAKKSIEEVILRNIDSRISSLWVSDYKSYIQKLADESQVVVEIWGVADLDQAKEIIGKTVELEFRLASDDDVTPETIAQRKQLAEKVRAEAVLNPDKMVELYENQASENIYAQTISWTLAALPEIYKENVELLNTIPLNQVSNIVEGTYTTSLSQAEDGSVTSENVDWFLVFRVTSRDSEEKTGYSPSDIISVANQLWYEYDVEDFKEDNWIAEGVYKIDWGKLLYNLWAGSVEADKKAYKVRIIQLDKESTLWKTGDEVDQIDSAFDALVASVQADLKANPEMDVQTWTELANWYLTEETIESYVGEYEPAVKDVKVYTTATSTYVVYTDDVKEEGESIYSFLKIEWIQDAAAFEDTLKNQTTYTIDEIFVQDRLLWKIAQGKDGSPLNWAYFSFARPETTEFWEPSVGIEFNGAWKEIFCEVTSQNIGRSMWIFIWGVPATIATIQTRICDGRAQISWGFDKEKAQETAKELNSWNMPAPLILLQEEKVSPSLGDYAFQGALIATLVGIIAIVLYIFFIYGRRKAIVTAATMVMFMVVLAAFLKLVDYALSLSWIAAIILSIGMAVDANILIFERMNEEVNEWKTYLASIKSARKRSWSAIRDGQISTLLIWLLLFAYGINMFKWFGSMIILTALMTMFINVPFIEEMLETVYRGKKD